MGARDNFEREQGPFHHPKKNSCLIMIVQNDTLLEKLIPKINRVQQVVARLTKWTDNSSVSYDFT